jgi:hypothetical protein
MVAKMTEQDLVRKEVEKTLASLDRMERLDAGSAFFAKLQARLEAEARKPAPARRPGFFPVLLPRLRPVLLGLLILINILTVVFVAKAGRSGAGAKKTSVMTVADDYSLDQNLDDFNLSGEEKGK